MNTIRQVAHVAIKDLRSVGALIGGYFLMAVMMAVYSIRSPGSSGSLSWFALPAFVIFGMVIVASMIHGDAPTQPNALWATKPLRPMAVFAAKLVAAIVGLVLVPVIAQTFAMHARHIEGAELARLAWHAAAEYALWLLIGVIVALLTRTLRTFIVTLVVAPIVLVIVGSLGFTLQLEIFSVAGVMILGIGGALALGVWIYARRDTRPWRIVPAVVCSYAVLMSIVVAFFGELPRDLPAAPPLATIAITADSGYSDYAAPFSIIVQSDTTGTERVTANDASLVVLTAGDSVVIPVTQRILLASPLPRFVPGLRWSADTIAPRTLLAGGMAFSFDSAQQAVLSRGIKAAYLTGHANAWRPYVIDSVQARRGATRLTDGRWSRVTNMGQARGNEILDFVVSDVVRAGEQPSDFGFAFPRYAALNGPRRQALVLAPKSSTEDLGWMVLPSQPIRTDSSEFQIPVVDTKGNALPFDDAWFRASQIVLIGWQWKSTFPWKLPVTLASRRP